MYFTKEDILKIQQALSQLGVKDSELQETSLPKWNDYITIVQDGKNKKVSVQKFLNQFVNESFINLTAKYDTAYVNIKEAIKDVPITQRKKGLLISFIDINKEWKLYQFKGELSQFNNYTLWDDVFNLEKYVINSLLPDEEDITSIDKDFNGNSKLKFKDKKYDPSTFSGMGHKILRKNIVRRVNDDGTIDYINYLSANEFSDSNTIYEIKYDFDLNGKEIQLLENCILYYNGGSLKNGSIAYNNTSLIGQITNYNINYKGEYKSLDKTFQDLLNKINNVKDSLDSFKDHTEDKFYSVESEISENENSINDTISKIDTLTQTTDEKFITNDTQHTDFINSIEKLQPKKGTTAQRPILKSTDVGNQYYDTDIQSPIWWTGNAWKGTLSNISISNDGYWIINDKKTEYLAVPVEPILSISDDNKLQVTYDKGQTQEQLGGNPVYTLFRVYDNKLQTSVDLGKTWLNSSDNIAAQFRWINEAGTDSIGRIQISRDLGKTWEDLSINFTNNLCIKGYVNTTDKLPNDASLGDIYMVGPTYSSEDVEHTNPIYRMWVKQTSGWIDNGSFGKTIVDTSSIIDKSITKEKLADDVISQEFGFEEKVIVSQKALSNCLFGVNKLGYGTIYGTVDRNGKPQIRETQDYVRTDYLPISGEKKIYIKNCVINKYFFAVAFYDENKVFISAPLNSDSDTESTNFIDAEVDIPENAKYVILTLKVGENTIIYFDYSIPVTVASLIADLEQLKNKKIDTSDLKNSSISSDKLQNKSVTPDKATFFKRGTKNLFNPDDSNVLQNYYLGRDNVPIANSNYIVTGYIPFNREDKNLIVSTNERMQDGGGYSFVYDKDKNPISGDINSATGGIVTWQEGVAYARFSLTTIYGDKHQVEVGTVITPYEEYDGSYYIDTKYLKDNENLNTIKSILGSDSISIGDSIMNNNTIYNIPEFPYHMKKGNCISFTAQLSKLSTLLIGNGYNQYRGLWLKINSSQVQLYSYETEATVIEEVSHNLNINNIINVAIQHTEQGQIHLVLGSVNGTFVHTFSSIKFETNYAVFAYCSGSTITNFKLSATNSTFKYPLWMFGDSYFGVDDSRWIGQIKNYGYWNFLVNGLAGQNSINALADLQRALNFGTPKYLVWCLGMNDTDANWKSVYNQVRNICEVKGITLILSTIPTVPTRDKETINQIVRESGLKYIDFANAVGATSTGVWYDDCLSQDGVHPTVLGAKLLSAKALTDCSEIMQYGVTV